jgi:transposase
VQLKQLLLEALGRQTEILQAYQLQIVDLKEQIALLRQRLFGRKSEQSIDPNTPQLALFNEAESVALPVDEPTADEAEEEVVAPAKWRSKRKPLPAELPLIEVIH